MQDRREDEMAQLGVEEEAAKAWIAQQAPQEDEGRPEAGAAPLCVWPENVPVLTLFLRLQTQWRSAPSGRLIGLRYGEAERVMRLAGTRKKRRVFEHLQEMERAVLQGQGDD